MQKKGRAKKLRGAENKRRERLRGQLLGGVALVGLDPMREMLRLIHKKKLSRQEIACRVVDLMEARKQAVQ